MADSNYDSLTELMQRMEHDFQDMKNNAADLLVLPNPADLSILKDAESLYNAKLRMQSAYEALKAADIYTLPECDAVMLKAVSEKGVEEHLKLAKSLAMYEKKILELQQEKGNLEKLIQDAEKISEKLEGLLNEEPEENHLEVLKSRNEVTKEVFAEVKIAFNRLLESYRSKGNDQLPDAIADLANQFFDNPRDPYIDVSNWREDVVQFLVDSDIAVRNKTHHSKLCLASPDVS